MRSIEVTAMRPLFQTASQDRVKTCISCSRDTHIRMRRVDKDPWVQEETFLREAIKRKDEASLQGYYLRTRHMTRHTFEFQFQQMIRDLEATEVMSRRCARKRSDNAERQRDGRWKRTLFHWSVRVLRTCYIDTESRSRRQVE